MQRCRVPASLSGTRLNSQFTTRSKSPPRSIDLLRPTTHRTFDATHAGASGCRECGVVGRHNATEDVSVQYHKRFGRVLCPPLARLVSACPPKARQLRRLVVQPKTTQSLNSTGLASPPPPPGAPSRCERVRTNTRGNEDHVRHDGKSQGESIYGWLNKLPGRQVKLSLVGASVFQLEVLLIYIYL